VELSSVEPPFPVLSPVLSVELSVGTVLLLVLSLVIDPLLIIGVVSG
jgi:hypothetical protein